MEQQALETIEFKSPTKKPGYHNQGNIKAAGRGIILEALTAWKGGKVGKRGLLFRAMQELERAYESEVPETRAWAVENTLKLAMSMTKDDKGHDSLADLLKGGSNVQVNFNSYFTQRSGSDQASSADPGLTIGFTPPPGSPGLASSD